MAAVAFAAAAVEADMRVGIIGLDTSHVLRFTEAMNVKRLPCVDGFRVTTAYQWGSRDIVSATNRYPQYIAEMGKMGVRLVPTIEALIEDVDCICLETNDGREHLRQAEKVFASGKPCFIDKPLAHNLKDALAIYDLGRRMGAKYFSSSCLRYGKVVQAARNGDYGRIRAVSISSPAPEEVQGTHNAYAWYGIHGFEPYVTVMGIGAEKVSCFRTPTDDAVNVAYPDGRLGQLRLFRDRPFYTGYVLPDDRSKPPVMTDGNPGYEPLLAEIAKFFKTGVVPFPPEETLEVAALMEASEMSAARGGAPVTLAEAYASVQRPDQLTEGLAADAEFTVDFTRASGRIRRLNGLNNTSPLNRTDFPGMDTLADFRELEIPVTRYHDAALENPGMELVDISRLFPLFHADPDDERNWNFAPTDEYVQRTLSTGSAVEYRLGESIELSRTRYQVRPPTDFAKWAKLCERIVRHYNEGWANGHRLGIEYWGIWEESDNRHLMDGKDAFVENYLPLYEVTSKRLKKAFPNIRVGGPHTAGRRYLEQFVKFCREKDCPLDFCAWNSYERDPKRLMAEADGVRSVLDRYGFTHTETELSEWHYSSPDWWRLKDRKTYDGFTAELRSVESAAYAAAVLIAAQDSKFDRMFYYAATYESWGLLDHWSRERNPSWYAFRAFAEVAAKGAAERVVVPCSPAPGVYALASRTPDGRAALLVAAYREDATGRPLDGVGEVNGVRVENVPAADNAPFAGDLMIRLEGMVPESVRTLDRARRLDVQSPEFRDGVLRLRHAPRETALWLVTGTLSSKQETAEGGETHDLVIYGSTPAGISAAVQAKRMGLDCVIVSPERRIGGLTTGGLGQTDIGNKAAFGGIALEFYRAVADFYRDEGNWKWQKRADYLPDGQCKGSKGEDSMWTFEPSAALKILEGWEKRDGLVIRRGECLDRTEGKVRIEGDGRTRRIVSFLTESGKEYRGKMFIDATYEGDLMAAAGVSYAVGREANAVYGEAINGNAPEAAGAWNHNVNDGVSAYVKPGDRSSGLLPGVEPYDPNEKPGDGDRRVQAYCFRMCLTDVPENRIPFVKPANYDERSYEILFRDFEAAWSRPGVRASGQRVWTESAIPLIMSGMPNCKTDSNNRCGFSTDFIGANWAWPEASYAERERILKAHLDYQMGLLWTLANHPRVPQQVRTYMSRFGTCKDEFADGLGNGWQRQLYVREARRMVGDYVMTEHNCRGTTVATRPVAMGAYTMDSHHVRRLETKDGFVRNEGNVEDHHMPGPYGIDYGAIVPRRGECTNLFVPVCISASHIAFGSIRMEPVFFALGQVAGTAAAQSISAGCAVQDLPYPPLVRRLIADGQVVSSKSHLSSDKGDGGR